MWPRIMQQLKVGLTLQERTDRIGPHGGASAANQEEGVDCFNPFWRSSALPPSIATTLPSHRTRPAKSAQARILIADKLLRASTAPTRTRPQRAP